VSHFSKVGVGENLIQPGGKEKQEGTEQEDCQIAQQRHELLD
jgi:hypothetical protein